MAAKKAPKRAGTIRRRQSKSGGENGGETKRRRLGTSGTSTKADGAEAVQAIVGALANHESAIRQLAQVVVNLHANVSALRDAVDALAEGASGARGARARERLRRVQLEE
jgi:hypothetical protein